MQQNEIFTKSQKICLLLSTAPYAFAEFPTHTTPKSGVLQIGKRSEPQLGRSFPESGHDWRRMADPPRSEEEESGYESNLRTER